MKSTYRYTELGCPVAIFHTFRSYLSFSSLELARYWIVSMAEVPEPMEKGLEELEEEITCPVCQEHFHDPKVLPCLHYYCKECIRQLAVRAGSSSPFSCPECRRETVLPQNDADQLPTAFFVNRIKELRIKMEKARGKVEVICEMCSRAKGEAFCRQCAEFICSDCVRSHRYMKVFASHKVVTLQELKEGGGKEITLKEAPSPMCKDHDEQLKIFCFDCNCLVCRDCVIRDHAGHMFEFVKKSAPQCKKTIKENVAPLKNIQANISAATREIEMVEGEISEHHKAITGTIEQSFKQLHEILYKREKQLLDRAYDLKQQKLDALGAQKKGFTLVTSEIQGVVEFVERSVENATDEEFMSLQQHIQQQIQEQCKKHEHIDLLPAQVANVGVRVACAEGIADLCQKRAEVIVLRGDPSKCTAEGPGTKYAEVGKSAKFTVHTVYQNGQFCREKQVVKADLNSVVGNSIVHTDVSSKGSGVYEVTYTPRVRGRHTLIVKLNGTQIAGSPLQVFVKIDPTHLGKPVRLIEDVDHPFGIALNSRHELVVAEFNGQKMTVFDKDGKKIQTITSEKCLYPDGLTIDKHDNIYVSDGNSLFKFSKEWKLMKTHDQPGIHAGGFNDIGLMKAINDQLYVCDRGNNRIQILNTKFKYINSFGCYGDGNGQFKRPTGIAQDRAGNLYVTDSHNHRVQVFDYKGQFLYAFSRKDAASKLKYPRGICVSSDEFVYVCEKENKCVSVFRTSGEFVTSFGQFSSLAGIVIDDDGFVYVGDHAREGRVYIL